MKKIPSVSTVNVYPVKKPPSIESMIAINVTGEVNTTGWTHERISPRFYIVPPADGIWDFDFIGDEPSGIVGQIMIPVSARDVLLAPKWCVGVRVHADKNSIVAKLHKPIPIAVAGLTLSGGRGSHTTVHRTLASFDDSIQPTGATKYDPWPHAQMKKLHHDLVLTVEGPDENKINSCINQALASGLIAAIVAACASGGAAVPAAISAFLGSLEACLGKSFTAKVDDQSHWIYWWT